MTAHEPETADGPALLEHGFDGIREYDNPQPGWWSALFLLTVVWAVGYVGYYHYGVGQSVEVEYQKELARRAAERAAMPGFEPTEDMILGLGRDGGAIAEARTRFASTCVACHGPEGGGGIGPNLTDDYWIHGGSPLEVYRTIHDGVPEKGMLRWSETIPPFEIAKLAAYVGSLRGTSPKNPKQPEGVRAGLK